MSLYIVFDWVLILGSAFFGSIAFDKKRIRLGWAKTAFVVSAVVGLAKGVTALAWDLGWFALDAEASRRLDGWLYMAGGLFLGFICSLIFSGQLVGTKVPPANSPLAQ